MTRPTRVTVDLSAARANLRRARELAPNSKLMAVVKADGYGHGIVRMAGAFADADALGVASLDEAEVLRRAGVEQRIVLLEGPFDAGEFQTIVELNLDTVIHSHRQLEYLPDGKTPNSVWLKVDTGMHRLGFDPCEFRAAYERIASVVPEVILMSHFANADDRSSSMVEQQSAVFDALVDGERPCSLANSAGLLGWRGTHRQWVRPGVMLYGVSPFIDTIGRDHDLKPVMSLETELISTRHVAAGESVGYGGRFRASESMPVGVAACGYGDGYPRHAGTGTPVLVNGARCRVIGECSMDMIAIDLSAAPGAQIGDRVTLWGAQLPVEEIARSAGTIPYELLCGMKLRARFVETDD
ncbi:MAG: alanine racemase [Pseudomonadota bacterium]